MERSIWLDEHSGPTWTYGLTNRPLGTAQVPDGWLLGSNKTHPQFRHGTVQYPRELTPDEVAGFELALVPEEA